MRRPDETVSFSLYGREMAGSVREKGRWAGVTFESPAPIPAKPLKNCQKRQSIQVSARGVLHDENPVDNIRRNK